MNNVTAIGTPGTLEFMLIILIWAVMVALAILAVVWFRRKTLENIRENVRLRLEVGKLADELEQIRKQRQAG